MKCKRCNKDLGEFNRYGRIAFDVDYKDLGMFCIECKDIVENELKKQRLVETYKDNEIYVKDDRYYPYWKCLYHFKNIEDVRARIDDSNIAIIF